MKNAEELRDELAQTFSQLKSGAIKPSEAAELANLAGKMIASAKAHYSEAKYQSLQRTYEQARDEAKHLYGECLMLADVLRDAFEVVKTIEGEDPDECDKLQDLRISIEYALAAYDERRIETANVQGKGQTPQAQVACNDGLCGNGSEVGAGGTAVDIAQAPDIHAELTMAAFHREIAKMEYAA